MLYPEISKLMEGLDSRYSLVIVTAKRARQLVCDASNDKTVSRAIKEIADGKIKCVKGSREERFSDAVAEFTATAQKEAEEIISEEE